MSLAAVPRQRWARRVYLSCGLWPLPFSPNLDCVRLRNEFGAILLESE